MTKLKVRKNGTWEWMQTGLTPHPSVPGVSLQTIDGGPQYYGNHGYHMAAPVLDDPTFFPIGVWYESVISQADIDKDKDTGLNVYVMLVEGSDMALIRANDMYAISPYPITGYGSETIGWMLHDEPDMRFNAGWEAGQGYWEQKNIVDALPNGDGRFAYSNYGKGTLLRTWGHPATTEVYYNNFQQTMSTDLYWFTDGDLSSQTGTAPWNQAAQFYDMFNRDFTADEAMRACHYGNVVRHMRQFVTPYRWQPVWGFVENGGPFGGNTQQSDYIEPESMKAAVWHSIIGGARGIIYFNHTFAGPEQSQHNFRMPAYAAVQLAAKEVNEHIQSLAPVLNDSFAIGFASVTPAPTLFNGIEHMVKYHQGTFYIFAGTRTGTNGVDTTATFTVPASVGTSATVLFENRTVPIIEGQFTDAFENGNSIHIYRID